MDITYFNWQELLLHSNKDLAAIICLVFAQTNLYNKETSKTLMNKLKIHHIPTQLFQSKLFSQYKTSLVCLYKTREPQSYFKNPKFLTYGVPARDKVVYLRALSMRRISDRNDYIPRYFYPELKKNFFLNITEDKIYFPLESSIIER